MEEHHEKETGYTAEGRRLRPRRKVGGENERPRNYGERPARSNFSEHRNSYGTRSNSHFQGQGQGHEESSSRRFGEKARLHIGMSPALVIGHPTTLVVSLLLIPVVLLLAVVLPGNKFLPLASLAGLFYLFPVVLPITRGNVLKTFLCMDLNVDSSSSKKGLPCW